MSNSLVSMRPSAVFAELAVAVWTPQFQFTRGRFSRGSTLGDAGSSLLLIMPTPQTSWELGGRGGEIGCHLRTSAWPNYPHPRSPWQQIVTPTWRLGKRVVADPGPASRSWSGSGT